MSLSNIDDIMVEVGTSSYRKKRLVLYTFELYGMQLDYHILMKNDTYSHDLDNI